MNEFVVNAPVNVLCFMFSKMKTLLNVEAEDLMARPGSPVQLLLY